VIITIVLLFVAFTLIMPYVYSVAWEYVTRSYLHSILESSNSADDIKKAIRPDGLFLTFPDGSWIAIVYRDNHAGSVRSISFARDSSGQWYEGHHHFCGGIGGISKEYELEMGLREMGEDITQIKHESYYGGLPEVWLSKSLPEAREKIVEMRVHTAREITIPTNHPATTYKSNDHIHNPINL